jgi:hypothetical protein
MKGKILWLEIKKIFILIVLIIFCGSLISNGIDKVSKQISSPKVKKTERNKLENKSTIRNQIGNSVKQIYLIVDRIEDGVVSYEDNKGRIHNCTIGIMPRGIKEGDIIRMKGLKMIIDKEAREKRSKEMMKLFFNLL